MLIDSTGIKLRAKASEMKRIRKQSGRLFSRRTRKQDGSNGALAIVLGPIVDNAPGARFTSRSTSRRWRSELSSSPPATSAMPFVGKPSTERFPYPPHCPNCHDDRCPWRTAIIPPHKNARPWRTATPGVKALNEALRATQYLGRARWRRWSGYHRRNRAEICRGQKTIRGIVFPAIGRTASSCCANG